MAQEEQKKTDLEPGGSGGNKTLIIIIVIIALVVLGIIGRYIWSRVSQQASKEIAEELVEQSVGNDAEIEIDQGEWPSKLETDAQYPGSKVRSSSSYESGEEEGVTVSLTSTDSIDQIYAYYVGLEDKGWEVSYKFKSSHSDVGASASASLEKGEWSIAVTANEQEDENNSLISILASKSVE